MKSKTRLMARRTATQITSGKTRSIPPTKTSTKNGQSTEQKEKKKRPGKSESKMRDKMKSEEKRHTY